MSRVKVKVLHSRTRLGKEGDVISVTLNRLEELLEKGLVERIQEKKQEPKKPRKGKGE